LASAGFFLPRLNTSITIFLVNPNNTLNVDYLNKLLPMVRPGGLIVAHNISGGMADPAFVSAITTNATLETLFLNTGNSGMSASMKKR
jgi:predicted O-methyltransferase YrrM